MEKRKVALRFIEIGKTLNLFWEQMNQVGLDPERTCLNKIDIVKDIAAIYGIRNEHDLEVLYDAYSDRVLRKRKYKKFLDEIEEVYGK